MKALLTLKSAIDRSAVVSAALLVSLVSVVYPEISVASGLQASGQQALVFEIKDPKSILENKATLTFDEIVLNDPVVAKLEAYLKKHNSPLAEYAADIVQQPQWQRALAISWVESNFGRRCADNNCSGIGVAPGHPSWRRYPTKLDWFKDMAQLLERPIYKERFTTFKQMRGVYVQPGSDAWVYGATKKYNELMALEKEATEERLAQAAGNTVLALNK